MTSNQTVRPACWGTWVASLTEGYRLSVCVVLLPAADSQLASRLSCVRLRDRRGLPRNIVNVYRYRRVMFAVRVGCSAREHTSRV